MHCIFCHKDSYSSRSVEHIIPESLGNKSMFLPHGYVCDECNHYFAIKIEKGILSQPYFISLRSRTEIYSKKNKLVKQSIRFPDVSLNREISNKDIKDAGIKGNIQSIRKITNDQYLLIKNGK